MKNISSNILTRYNYFTVTSESLPHIEKVFITIPLRTVTEFNNTIVDYFYILE